MAVKLWGILLYLFKTILHYIVNSLYLYGSFIAIFLSKITFYLRYRKMGLWR